MEKPSVVLRHYAACAVSGILLVWTGLIALLDFFQPNSERGVTWLVESVTILLAVGFFCWGRSWERLDETGIHVKTPFYERKYLWSDVEKVCIAVTTNTKGGRYPIISLRIRNRRFSLKLDYTKKAMMCVSSYYGNVDEDKWGKPPGLL